MTTHLTDGRSIDVCDRALCGFNPITNCLTEDRAAVTCADCLEVMRGSPRTCRPCAHSFMEPDDDLTCGHPDSGTFGLYVGNGRGPDSEGGHCGASRIKFKQHPLRTLDGNPKS